MDQNPNDVLQGSSPVASEGSNTQTGLPVVPEVTPVTPTPQVGSQTPPENLYAALAEERRLRKEAEDKLSQVTTSPFSEDDMSDEGRLLRAEIQQANDKIAKLEEEKALDRVYTQFPDLKNLSSEFETYKKDFPRHKLENVAKLFLSEKGLIETPRVGLENPTGGPRTPVSSGLTSEQVADLRKNNFKKYQEMLMNGQIQISDK